MSPRSARYRGVIGSNSLEGTAAKSAGHDGRAIRLRTGIPRPRANRGHGERQPLRHGDTENARRERRPTLPTLSRRRSREASLRFFRLQLRGNLRRENERSERARQRTSTAVVSPSVNPPCLRVSVVGFSPCPPRPRGGCAPFQRKKKRPRLRAPGISAEEPTQRLLSTMSSSFAPFLPDFLRTISWTDLVLSANAFFSSALSLQTLMPAASRFSTSFG